MGKRIHKTYEDNNKRLSVLHLSKVHKSVKRLYGFSEIIFLKIFIDKRTLKNR